MWEGLEIEYSNTLITLNKKGEWGSNLEPKLANTAGGELEVEHTNDKGRKR